jgi:5-methyltetrahydrofolate--homocysteine methyltransferase
MLPEYTAWRNFDLTSRITKIRGAFDRRPVTAANDVPIVINTPCYYSFGSLDKPPDYYTNPASMLAYQTSGFEKHLSLVNDDLVPYFMPWFGTGVLASGFGTETRVPEDPSDDPASAGPCIHSPKDVSKLKLPNPYTDGWMPRVLNMIDYAREHGDLPVGLTDMQGPLDTVGQMCGQSQLYQWMHHEPQMIHDLFDLVTDAFIEWVKVQKKHTGEPLEWSNGLQGVYSPGCGIWESDDDLVLINPDLYREFAAPRVERIFAAFGGGSIHYCGKGNQHLDTFETIPHLRVINNSPMANFDAFTQLVHRYSGRITIQIQDASPVNIEDYYDRLFAGIEDFRGLMLATWVLDNTGMDGQGGYIPVTWDPMETANRIANAVRSSIARRLSGESTLPADDKPSQAVFHVEKPSEQPTTNRPDFTPQQAAALTKVHDCLADFDSDGLQDAVRDALHIGLQPFTIIQFGMAEGMQTVGQKYERGEYFLPDLVMAGATMQDGMQILKPALKDSDGGQTNSKGKVVLGTVKGDMHDIGKNLVSTMLEGAQFEVIDLGVDVPPEKFVEAVRANQPEIVAMSALLTTTLKSMKDTVDALQKAGVGSQVKIMIGGAPVSREYADQIGAQGYADSAVGAVYEAERLLKG